MSRTFQEVKQSFLADIGQSLWRRRNYPGMRWLTSSYIALMRKSMKWWLQALSLIIIAGFLIVMTQAFIRAYLNNQYLKQNGQQKLLMLETALLDEGPLRLAIAQKELLEYIHIAKQIDTRYPLISRLGVDASKTQICPFSKMLFLSIEKGFILPTQMQLEEALNGFYQNWPNYDKKTREFLYPIYLHNFQYYLALKNDLQDIDIERLAQFWHQSMNQTEAEQSQVNTEDLKNLLRFYFRLKSHSIQLNEELVDLVEEQLEESIQ